MTPRSSAAWWSSSLWAAWVVALVGPRPVHGVDKSAKEEAAAISQVATAKHQAGEFGLCAEFFHQAYDKDPTYLPYLFSAARCLHKKGDLDAAERDYRQFLARSPKGAQLVDKAQEYLDQLLEARKHFKGARPDDPKTGAPQPADAVAKPADAPLPATPTVALVAPPSAPPERPMAGREKAGWAAVGLGVISLGAGAWALASAASERAALHQDLAPADSKLVLAISRSDAEARAARIGTRTTLGAVATGAGAVLAAAGAWLALRGPVELAVAPQGAQVTVFW
ncbi:MAG: hypothetical protein FJ100_02665 [Deltaproteobacteria bacterium]|nr:hypothetical protein [Deltaproteobacteria bacterium]